MAWHRLSIDERKGRRCASANCDDVAATFCFERGGIASDYCTDCHKAIIRQDLHRANPTLVSSAKTNRQGS